MLPLLLKDGLVVPYVATSVLFISIVFYYYQNTIWLSFQPFKNSSFHASLFNNGIKVLVFYLLWSFAEKLSI
jgi:hypothetical protein